MRRRRYRGQALVEFALVIPLFLFILFGLIDAARFVYMNSTLSQAAREGARVGAVQAGWIPPAKQDSACNLANGPVCPADVPTMVTNITAAANQEMTPFGSVGNVYTSCDLQPDSVTGLPALPSGNWTGQTCAAAKRVTGDVLSVRVTGTFRPITPVISTLIGNVLLSAASSFVIN